ncbi:MAG: class I SAM-dependent methyltransferase [Candidatus Saganbacteria bacterium]|nr:class I SAM-dependent methyltransferase [Candidatus Saganbacteria bacterium]
MALEFRGAIAGGYEAWFSTVRGRYADRLEKKVISGLVKIRPGEKILDVGCGTGHFSAFFRKMGGQVTGLEPSPEMLAEARRLYGERGINFIAGNAERLPFADRSFDLVTLITVLELLDDPGQALAEAFRVGKGKVFLGILNRDSIINRQRAKTGKGIWRQVHFYTLREIRALLGKGAKVVWRGALHLPLPASERSAVWRYPLESLLSNLKMLGGAFIGMMAERKDGRE